jgi:hypothetical protein
MHVWPSVDVAGDLRRHTQGPVANCGIHPLDNPDPALNPAGSRYGAICERQAPDVILTNLAVPDIDFFAHFFFPNLPFSQIF